VKRIGVIAVVSEGLSAAQLGLGMAAGTEVVEGSLVKFTR
jgi:hypothetical protein